MDKLKRTAYEFIVFGLKQAWACLFGGLILFLILATMLFYPENAPLYRYDFLFLAALFIQIGLFSFRLESPAEAKAIILFHIVGTVMEIFKTHIGSWEYPGEAVFRIGGVPLFTGFMYSAVGSYITRIWRIFDIKYERHPPLWACALLSVAIYINFFAHHFLPDIRNLLFILTALLFGRTWFYFKPLDAYRKMPMLLGFFLVAIFIYIAENIGTFAGAWAYPGQSDVWQPVRLGKLGAWFLLMIISYVMVFALHKPTPWRGPATP